MRQSPPLVIPIFITHHGCPHRCVFCNQQPITGQEETQTNTIAPQDVAAEIKTWLARSSGEGRDVQVAFYGGSFTGMEVERQEELLEAVQPFIVNKKVGAIRLSTRPDYIHKGTAAFLQEYGVGIVEIGVQSMDQHVLDKSIRGHSVAQAEKAIRLMKQSGMTVGAQLMIGLPGETTRSAISGAKRLAKLKPDFTRIYPTLIIKGSGLERLFESGDYSPLSMNKTIALAARLKTIFDNHLIPVVRIGLQPSDDLKENLVAGPYHPSLGELVQSRVLFSKIRSLATATPRPKSLRLAGADRSIFIGNKRCTIKRLEALNLLQDIVVEFVKDQRRGTVDIM